VGFGISNPSQARAIAKAADGIIVGSAIIKLIEKNLGKKDIPQKAGRFIKRLVNAVKGI